MRAPLLGMYALCAEWLALMDPGAEPAVARLKLAWWQEEIARLAAGVGVHPISIYLAALPRPEAIDFSPLGAAIAAAAAQINGAPLETAADLEPQAEALWGGPLQLASRMAAPPTAGESLRRCTTSLSAAAYLMRAIRDYRREARAGRVPFPVADLLAAGIDNADLAAPQAPEPLRNYLERLRSSALSHCRGAEQALRADERRPQRHLLVLCALTQSQLRSLEVPQRRRRFSDMFLAWKTARRAH